MILYFIFFLSAMFQLIIGEGGRSFAILFILRWGMDHILVFDIICGVGIDP